MRAERTRIAVEQFLQERTRLKDSRIAERDHLTGLSFPPRVGRRSRPTSTAKPRNKKFLFFEQASAVHDDPLSLRDRGRPFDSQGQFAMAAEVGISFVVLFVGTYPFAVEVGRRARRGAGQISLPDSTFQTVFRYAPLPI